MKPKQTPIEALARKLALEYINGYRREAGKPPVKRIGPLWWKNHSAEFMAKATAEKVAQKLHGTPATGVHDPEMDIDENGVTNGKRAAWAETGLRAFATETRQIRDINNGGICVDEHIKDLITDSCHLAHREGATLEEIRDLLDSAYRTFDDELGHGEYASNGCEECARSHGPNYRGECSH